MKSLLLLIAAVSVATVLCASDDSNQTHEEPPISAKTIKFIDGIGSDVKTFLRDNKLIDTNETIKPIKNKVPK